MFIHLYLITGKEVLLPFSQCFLSWGFLSFFPSCCLLLCVIDFFIVTCFDSLLISFYIYSIDISFVVIIACDTLLFSCCFQDSHSYVTFSSLITWLHVHPSITLVQVLYISWLCMSIFLLRFEKVFAIVFQIGSLLLSPFLYLLGIPYACCSACS